MYCTPVTILFLVILILIAIFFLAITLYALYAFCRQKREETTKLKTTFEVIFLSSTIICSIFLVLLAFGSCDGTYSESTFIDLHLYCGGFFLIQGFMTLVLFYTKLLRIFDGTVYGISKVTKFIYNLIFIILGIVQCIWLVLTFISMAGYDTGTLIFLIIPSLLITMMLNISMTILFACKLAKTIKGVMAYGASEISVDSNSDGAQASKNKKKNDRLLGAIAKLTTLVSISLMMTFTDYVWQNIADQPSLKTKTWMLVVYVWFADLITNFLCIILCYPAFKAYYVRFCGCMDNCCRSCASKVCHRCAGKPAGMRVQRVQSDVDMASKPGNLSVDRTDTKEVTNTETTAQ